MNVQNRQFKLKEEHRQHLKPAIFHLPADFFSPPR